MELLLEVPAQRVRVSFSEFIAWVDSGQVASVTITGNEITGVDQWPRRTSGPTLPPQYEGLVNRLIEKNVIVQAKEPTASPWAALLLSWAPILLLIGFWIFFMRQMQSGGNKALSFGKSKAKLSSSAQKKVTFSDVAGVEEAKEELQEIIEFLKEPQKFQKLGGRIPKGVLLMGPPGTGKTLLARAVAGEANVPFFSISGSDFVEMFVGVGASRVRDLFEQGKKNAPCIIFIDEIDAVGRHRGAGLGGGHDEREQTLNQLLVEMDGFESNEGVILMAATNRPDVLDPALLRPGRFDRRVVVNRPDVRGREGILEVHTRKIPLAGRRRHQRPRARHRGLHRRRPRQPGQRSGAQRRARQQEARRDGRLRVRQGQGADGRRAELDDRHRRREEGHGVSRSRPRAGRHPAAARRSGAQGDDHPARHGARRHDVAADRREAQLLEELPDRSDRHPARRPHRRRAHHRQHHDRRRQRPRARHRPGARMVCEWGMSEAMGPLTFGKKEEQIFLGREIAQHSDYSEDTALKIDAK